MKTVADRKRLDVALVDQGLVPTRAKAQAAILAGEVYVDGVRAAKAGAAVGSRVRLEVRPRRPAFVSRGGIKLDHALTVFGLEVTGRRAVDVGASTGGFTDCLLRRGARRVYAIDVGTGQLDWSLRGDARVVVLEDRDVREVTVDALDGPADLAVIDVAFISLGHIFPAVRGLVRHGADAIALVKPQFEAGPKAAPRGVVRDPAVHLEVLRRIAAQAVAAGFSVRGATYSPIAGPEGNLEFFLHLRAGPEPGQASDLEAVVTEAHAVVRRKGEGR